PAADGPAADRGHPGGRPAPPDVSRRTVLAAPGGLARIVASSPIARRRRGHGPAGGPPGADGQGGGGMGTAEPRSAACADPVGLLPTAGDDAELGRVLDTMPAAFCAYDRQWRFQRVNAAAEQLLGRPRDELLGRVLWELWPA